MSKLTEDQRSTIQLLLRSNDIGDGWRQCSPLIWKTFILPMPDELLEKDDKNRRVRLTENGKVLSEWI